MNTTPIDHKIEFIVWDGFTKTIIRNTVDSYISIDDDGSLNTCSILNTTIPMQLTALRSINDEPIYNHMIVKSELWGHFLVDMFNYKLMSDLSGMQLEIVGNRFQHPELLELCK